MIARFCTWYLKKYTSVFWNAYNEGFHDGIEQYIMECEEE